MSTRKPYQLLRSPVRLTPTRLNSLLGKAVEEMANPIGGAQAPSENQRPARFYMDNLYPAQPEECDDFSMVLANTSDPLAHVRLQELVNHSLGRKASNNLSLDSVRCRRFEMHDARSKIIELLARPEQEGADAAPKPTQEGRHVKSTPYRKAQQAKSTLYRRAQQAKRSLYRGTQQAKTATYREAVLKLLREQPNGELFVMSGFVTCSDLTVTKSSSEERTAKFDTGDLVSPVHADGGCSSIHNHELRGTYKGEYLIACSYFAIKLIRLQRIPFVPSFIQRLPWVSQWVERRLSKDIIIIDPNEALGITRLELDGNKHHHMSGEDDQDSVQLESEEVVVVGWSSPEMGPFVFVANE